MHFDWDNFLYGMTLVGIVAHSVNTFPTPENKYGQWFLGIIKFAVGQRVSAMNAMRGTDTVSVSVPQGSTKEVQQKVQSTITESAGAVTIDEKKHTVIPTGTGTGTGE